MRQATARRYWVFRGEAGGDVAWGTASARAVAGAVSPVLMEPPQGLLVGPSLTVGEAPPAVSTTLVLADPDGAIVSRILPDRRGKQGLKGRIYVGEIPEDDSIATETPVSPTLHVAGTVTHQDGITTIPLQSDDSHVLGASIALWTVEEILDADLRSVTFDPLVSTAIDDYLDGRPASFLWGDARASLRQNRATTVPWLYDPCLAELIPLNDDYPRYWIAGIGPSPRFLPVVVAEKDGVFVAWNNPRSNRGMTTFRQRVDEFVATVEIRDALGNRREVPVVMFVAEQPPEEQPSRYLRANVSPAGVFIGRSPPQLLNALLTHHAPAGFDGADDDSMSRAINEARALYSGVCGGVFGKDGATIREVVQHIAPICGMRVWLGVDDKLHVSLSGYSYQDAQDAKGNLVELQEGDVFPRDTSNSPAWEAEIAGDPDDDQSGVARVSIQWSEDQREIYPIETSSSTPVLGDGPGDSDRELILSGAWIVPSRGIDVVGAIQAGMSADATRVTLTTHMGAHTLRPAQLIRVSHPRGLGLPGMGWERRLARVDQVEILPGEDAVRLRLTDLGLSERMRLGILDSVQEWILALPTIGQEIFIEPIDEETFRIIDLARHLPGVPWDHGFAVWTPGAVEPVYRRSWRTVGQDGDDVLVDVSGLGLPDLGTVRVIEWHDDEIIGVGWAIMQTDLIDPSYRPDFIRACSKMDGIFESGEPGFQYSTY